MATVAPTTAGKVEVITVNPEDGITLPAAADLSAGTFVRQDTSGNWIQALGTSAANLKGARFSPRTVKSGEALTAYIRGVFGGFTISQAFNSDLFISDTGTLADAAGTAGAAIGRVIPGTANAAGAAHDKNVRIELPV